MSTRQRTILVAGTLLAIAIVLGSLGSADRIEEAIVPDAPYPGEVTGVPCDADCSVFVAAIAPPLRTLVSEGNALADLGNTRSRDVLELTVRMKRFQESADALQLELDKRSPPESLKSNVAEISVAIAAAQAAIDQAITALRGFDWDALGDAVSTFDTEIKRLIVLTDSLPGMTGTK